MLLLHYTISITNQYTIIITYTVHFISSIIIQFIISDRIIINFTQYYYNYIQIYVYIKLKINPITMIQWPIQINQKHMRTLKLYIKSTFGDLVLFFSKFTLFCFL